MMNQPVNGTKLPRVESDVVVVGSMNADVLTTVFTHPGPGETCGNGNAHLPDGKGANQTLAAARLRHINPGARSCPEPSTPITSVEPLLRVPHAFRNMTGKRGDTR